MSGVVVFDSESDGFIEDATKLWCICTLDISEKIVRKFYGKTIGQGLDLLMRADVLICHNIIKHDIPLIKKLYPTFSVEGIKIIDTLLLSQLLNPDRWGGHSVAAWGERFHYPKVEHEDWSKFSEEMLERCVVDTELHYKIYKQLVEDAGENIKGVKVYG